jgi:hypothetical protein
MPAASFEFGDAAVQSRQGGLFMSRLCTELLEAGQGFLLLGRELSHFLACGGFIAVETPQLG